MSKIAEVTPARFPAGTLARIDKVLNKGEPRSDFIRKAVENEIGNRDPMWLECIQRIDVLSFKARQTERRIEQLNIEIEWLKLEVARLTTEAA